jgi:hypothetical protein
LRGGGEGERADQVVGLAILRFLRSMSLKRLTI